MKEYHEAMDILKVIEAIDVQDADDATRMYADLVEELTKNYRENRLCELRESLAVDAKVIATLRAFQPIQDQELFEATGITPRRWQEVLAGRALERLEVALLCEHFMVEPETFSYDLHHNYLHGTKLKLIDSALPHPRLVHLRTKTVRNLPPEYLTIYWDDEGGTIELRRKAPAWKDYIHEYVASHEDDLMRKVFPEFDAEDRKAEAAVEEE